MNKMDYRRPVEFVPTEVDGKVTGVIVYKSYSARVFVCSSDGVNVSRDVRIGDNYEVRN